MITIKGQYLGDLIKVTSIGGRGPMTQEAVLQQKNGSPGSHYKKRRIPERPIPVTFELVGNSLEDIRKKVDSLNSALNIAQPESITFSDEPGLTYYGLISGEPEWDEYLNIGRGRFTFICPDPYKYGEEKNLVLDSMLIANEGSAETPLIFTVTFPTTIKTTDDFSGKVAGSTAENPHKVQYNNGETALFTPTTVGNGENNQSAYDNIKTLDGGTLVYTQTGAGVISQNLFSFDLIALIKRKFGYSVPGATTADKVAWLKENITRITANWWGKGSGPSGNKAYLAGWRGNTNVYESGTGLVSHTNGTISKLTGTSHPLYLTPEGFIHFLAYAEASDGTTASRLETDYVNLDVELKNNFTKDITITQQETGKFVKIIWDFAAGDVLEIDLKKRKVSINGVLQMTAYDWRSTPYMLLPGANTLTVVPAEVATTQITFRPRWL
jgi:predicted phage tail component-like protein